MIPAAILDVLTVSQETFLALGVIGLILCGVLNYFVPLVFPIPPLLLIIPLVAANPELLLIYVIAATLGEVVPGIIGYVVGARGGRPLIESRVSDIRIARIEAYFERSGFATVTIGSFAPIPEAYEVLSISSGVFGFGLNRFIVASVIGRGAKYLLAGLLVIAAGQAATSVGELEIYTAIAIVTVLVLAAYLTRSRWYSRSGVQRSA